MKEQLVLTRSDGDLPTWAPARERRNKVGGGVANPGVPNTYRIVARLEPCRETFLAGNLTLLTGGIAEPVPDVLQFPNQL